MGNALRLQDFQTTTEDAACSQPLSQFALRPRFDKARTLAKVNFQFRDILAKAATDIGDLAYSQKLLAHKNRDMTEHYVKARIGERVRSLRERHKFDCKTLSINGRSKYRSYFDSEEPYFFSLFYTHFYTWCLANC